MVHRENYITMTSHISTWSTLRSTTSCKTMQKNNWYQFLLSITEILWDVSILDRIHVDSFHVIEEALSARLLSIILAGCHSKTFDGSFTIPQPFCIAPFQVDCPFVFFSIDWIINTNCITANPHVEFGMTNLIRSHHFQTIEIGITKTCNIQNWKAYYRGICYQGPRWIDL